MKRILLFCVLLAACKSQEVSPEICYKGRLSLKADCFVNVIELIDGSIDTSKIESTWINPASGKKYYKAFTPAIRCLFPDNIKEGQEFFFKIDDKQIITDCITCPSSSPYPKKSLQIVICP